MSLSLRERWGACFPRREMFYRTFLCHQRRARDVSSGGISTEVTKRERKRRKHQAAAERGIRDPPELCSFISSFPQLVCAVLSRTT